MKRAGPRPHWTTRELDIVRDTYADGAEATIAALAAEGYHRSRFSIARKASQLGVRTRLRRGMSAGGDGALPTPLALFPTHHPRVADQLHALAESNPTPERFELERARILQERA